MLIAIEPQAFDLLRYLIVERDRVVSRDDFVAAVWRGRIVSESTINSRITAVRQAIGDSGDDQRLIRTVPRKGFRFVGDMQEEKAAGVSAVAPPPTAPAAPGALALPDRPSIAVLPFTNMSDDPARDYFADGMTEDVITELSRISWLLVIARSSTFTYKGRAVDVKQVGREANQRRGSPTLFLAITGGPRVDDMRRQRPVLRKSPSQFPARRPRVRS